MLANATRTTRRLAFVALTLAGTAWPAAAQDAAWRVAKVSGEAWIAGAAIQQSSLSQQPQLRPGDSIRTGRNGRVLLVRGAESMLVSANSAISLPEAGRAGMSTVIQQAGSILLDVEKRNVQHFEVETPYLAAVVKGTRFRVSIERGQAKVDVVRGQVQVADFRSGQFALVMPGQSARASATQALGLQLSGQGSLGRITQGAPQAARVAPLPVPGGGLKPPQGATPLTRGTAPGITPAPAFDEASQQRRRPTAAVVTASPQGGLRIAAPLGEVKLDIHKVTRGMASDRDSENGARGSGRGSVWNTGELNPGSGGNIGATTNSGTAVRATGSAGAAAASTASGSSGGAASASPGIAQPVAALGSNAGGNASGNSGGGNGNSNAGGNGNGNGKGDDKAAKDKSGKDKSDNNSGNGNAFGVAKNGNGNGNSGNGNGNGNGNGKAKGKKD